MGEVEANSLLFWCQKIVNDPEMLPAGTVTHCNQAVNRICTGMDYDQFHDKMANEIIAHCRKYWIKPLGIAKDQMEVAHKSAQVGDLALLGLEDAPHGHVAICAPGGPMVYSGKWGMYVPRVANVGKSNAFMGANYAFDKIPEVFILGKTIS